MIVKERVQRQAFQGVITQEDAHAAGDRHVAADSDPGWNAPGRKPSP